MIERRWSHRSGRERRVVHFVDLLAARERSGLLCLGRDVEFPPGAFLMAEGHRADSVIVLRRGQVKLVISDGHGRTHLLGVRGPGDIIGEAACIDDEPRSASVTALSWVRGTRIGCGAFVGFLREHPGAAIELLRIVTSRLRAADRSRLDLSGREVHPRLVRTIREVADAFPPAPGGRAVQIPLTQEELAQLISAASVSVQRTLRGLRERLIIVTRYRGVAVPCLTCLDIECDTVREGKNTKAIIGCGGTRSDH